MKWRNRTAQGFYEAELVKRSLRKRCFLLVAVFGSGYGKRGPVTDSLVLDRYGEGVMAAVMSKHPRRECLVAELCGLLDWL